MKLSIDGIKDKTAWEEAGIKLPAYDVRKVAENTKASPEWVHFGIGNIFRIFIGGIADSLIEQGVSDKGITCVETFDFDVVDKIYEPFDNLVMAGYTKRRRKYRQEGTRFSYGSGEGTVGIKGSLVKIKGDFCKSAASDDLIYNYREGICPA